MVPNSDKRAKINCKIAVSSKSDKSVTMKCKIKSPVVKNALLGLYIGIVAVGFIWNSGTLCSLLHKCITTHAAYVKPENNSTQIADMEADITLHMQYPDSENNANKTGQDNKRKDCFLSTHFLFNVGLFGVYVLSFILMFISYCIRRCLPAITVISRIPTREADKSLLADLINNDCVELVHPASNSLDYYSVERLIQNTWLYRDQERLGKDARCLQHKGIQIKTIFKIKNTNLWKTFMREKLMMNGKVLCKELQNKPIFTDKPDIMNSSEYSTKTVNRNRQFNRNPINADIDLENNESETTSLFVPASDALREHLKEQLHRDETYLFHGTKLENVVNIIENGFNHDKYSKGGLYGKAMYFAESSEKADQYADPINTRRRCDLTILVVRVLLGKTLCHDVNTPVKAPYRGAVGARSGACDSYVTAINKRFREFLVFDTRQCYPEYIVLYDRIYK